MGWPTLTTERLVLRPFTIDDLDALAALHAEEAFWRYPLRRGQTREETQAFLERTIGHYDELGMSVSAVVVAESGELAGWAGLAVPLFLPEILPAVEVGWRLGQRFWGHGYATEAARAWVRYGFDVLGLDEIVSIYEAENVASGAVMEHLGLTFARTAVIPASGIEVRITSVSREAWSSMA